MEDQRDLWRLCPCDTRFYRMVPFTIPEVQSMWELPELTVCVIRLYGNVGSQRLLDAVREIFATFPGSSPCRCDTSWVVAVASDTGQTCVTAARIMERLVQSHGSDRAIGIGIAARGDSGSPAALIDRAHSAATHSFVRRQPVVWTPPSTETPPSC